MFCIFIWFLNEHAYELETNPCSMCAKMMRGNIMCTLTSAGGVRTRTFMFNGTIFDDELRKLPALNLPDINKINMTKLIVQNATR